MKFNFKYNIFPAASKQPGTSFNENGPNLPTGGQSSRYILEPVEGRGYLTREADTSSSSLVFSNDGTVASTIRERGVPI